jgi:hypothetical protein
MGLFDTGATDPQPAGLLGQGFADPRSAAIMALAGSMVRGDFGGGLIGANSAFQNAATSNLQRADMAQQIGLRNIQLQQQMQRWKWLQDAMSGADAPQTQAAPNPNAPQIALNQGADQQPSLNLPDGSKLNTGGIGPTNANAQRIGTVAPVQIPVQSSNPYVAAGQALGMSPRQAIMNSMLFPEAFNKAYGESITPTEATRLAIAAGQDPKAVNAGVIRNKTWVAPTNIRGFGYIDPEGLHPLPMNTPAGYMPQQDPVTGKWGFTEIGNGTGAVQGSARAQAAGKAAVTPVTGYDSTGKPVFTNALDAATGGAGVGGSAGAPGNGRYPGNTPAGGPVAPALSPAAQAAGTAAGKGSGDQLVQDNTWANGFATRMFNLSKALTGLQNADTGPGSDAVNTAKSFLLAQTPAGLGKYLPGVDPNKIASYDEANKYLIQYAIGQAGSLGEGTDSKLATTLAGNANTHISNLAAQDVVRANMALERMKNAQVQQFNATGLPADKYQTWASKWNAQVNPSVFAWDTMTPEAKAKASTLMTPAQRQQFTAQYNWALQNHYIDGTQ